MMQRLRSEPVVLACLTRVLAVLGAKFGLELTVDDVFLIWGAVEVVTMLFVRGRVTPTATLSSDDRKTDPVPPPG